MDLRYKLCKSPRVASRDDEGNPVDHPGLRLHLSNLAYEGLAQNELGGVDTDIYIYGTQLCEHLDAADSQVKRALGEQTLAKEVKKRKRSGSPTEEMTSGDEARTPSKRREPRSPRIMTWIMKMIYQSRVSQTRYLAIPSKQTPS
ncbi:hypothetical protein J1614_010731 [Plenodomus biglobosus]|nr:hypothetical protein J1614_010731 [Plenodomus biglobosus]